MDVTDDPSMRAGVEQIVTETARIDVLVNNAGYVSYGAIEGRAAGGATKKRPHHDAVGYMHEAHNDHAPRRAR